MTKITVKDYFVELRELAERAGRADLVDFVDTRIAQVEAKNSKRSNKPSKNAVENADLGMKALDAMETGKQYTISAIQHAVPEFSGLSNQRVTAVVKVLVKTNLVTRSEVKGVAYFTKV